MNRNRSYPEEFKKQAVELAKELGSTPKAAIQLGISSSNIYEWKNKTDSVQTTKNSLVLTQASQSELKELKQLRKEVSDLKKVNHILKAAAAFFSQDHLK